MRKSPLVWIDQDLVSTWAEAVHSAMSPNLRLSSLPQCHYPREADAHARPGPRWAAR